MTVSLGSFILHWNFLMKKEDLVFTSLVYTIMANRLWDMFHQDTQTALGLGLGLGLDLEFVFRSEVAVSITYIVNVLLV